jgi:hypothetical protein
MSCDGGAGRSASWGSGPAPSGAAGRRGQRRAVAVRDRGGGESGRADDVARRRFHGQPQRRQHPPLSLERKLGRIIPHLFPHTRGRHRVERIQDFRQAWQGACRRAQSRQGLRHDFRRTAVRNLVH